MKLLILVVIYAFFFGSVNLVLARAAILLILFFFVLLGRKDSILVPNTSIVVSFLIFYLWLFITLTYSEGRREGVLMIIKLTFPLSAIYFAYISLTSKAQYLYFLDKVCYIIICYVIINGIAPIGRQIYKVIPDFFIGANEYHMAIFSAIPLSLFFYTRNKKYIFITLLCFIPALTYIRRAGLAGLLLSLFTIFVFRYKWKAVIPSILLSIFVAIIVFKVPAINERFFGGDTGNKTLSFTEFAQTNDMEDNLNTSGRIVMWKIVYDQFYVGHEMMGSGLGTMKAYLISNKNENRWAFMILHNDYLHLLCETGRIGLGLWLIFISTILFKLLKVYKNTKDEIQKMSAKITFASFIPLIFVMFFANMISSPFIFMMPFFLLGLHLKINNIC